MKLDYSTSAQVVRPARKRYEFEALAERKHRQERYALTMVVTSLFLAVLAFAKVLG